MTDATGIKISNTEHRIDLDGGGMIAIRSTHYPDNLRGAGLDFVVLDEAAYMHPSIWSEVVRPMLLETRGGAAFLSTPRGKNWFWDLFLLGLNPDEPEWSSFRYESWANPWVAYEEIMAIRRTTSEHVFREEYLAEFLDDSGQVFRGIKEAASAPFHASYQEGHRYVIGCDWAKENDYTCFVVMDATTRQMVAIDRFNKISWKTQRDRLSSLAERWHVDLIWAEANAMGTVLIEDLQREGLPIRPFMTTYRSKTPLIEGLVLAIERADLAILPDETLLNELASYQLERLPAGGYRYSAPPGLHDDTVIATALAWYGVQHGGIRVDFA